MNIVWETDEGEARNIILLIFVLWRCFNCRWVKDEAESLIWDQMKSQFFFANWLCWIPSKSEVSRYSGFIDNSLIISHTRQPYLPSRWVYPLAPGVTKGNENTAWIQGSIFFVFGVNQGNMGMGSKIFLCNPRGWKLLLRPSLGWCSLVYVED